MTNHARCLKLAAIDATERQTIRPPNRGENFMSARTPLPTSKPIACALVLALGVSATAAHASATPILSVSNVAVDSFNVGGIPQIASGPSIYTGSDYSEFNYTSTTTPHFTTEVVTEPTTTTAGLAYNYETDTTVNSWNLQTWKYDTLSIGVASNGTNQSDGKWIELTGSVQSSIDTTLSFNLSASGNFTAINTPFGSAAPLLASFYFGNSQPSSLSSSTNTSIESLSYYAYSTSYSTASFNLLAGVSQDFVAYVYAPTDVSVNNFSLYARTSDYDLVNTPKSQTYVGPKTLIGASVLAPIPEPETYAMLLAGLGLIGAVTRRDRAKAKALVN
jgi:hypothetical protein